MPRSETLLYLYSQRTAPAERILKAVDKRWPKTAQRPSVGSDAPPHHESTCWDKQEESVSVQSESCKHLHEHVPGAQSL